MEISKHWLLATTLLVSGFATSATASPGVYFGVGLGQSKLNETGIDDELGKRLFAGYQVNRFLAVETAYTDFGSFKSSSVGTSSKLGGLEASLMASYPIGRFSVFGRLGMWKWNYEVDGANGTQISSKDGSDRVHGAGVDFRFNNRLKVRGSWDEYQVDNGISNLISLNALYTF